MNLQKHQGIHLFFLENKLKLSQFMFLSQFS